MTAPTRNVEMDAERYNFLRCGGFALLRFDKYWQGVKSFDEAVDRARADVEINAAINKAKGDD